MNAAIKKKFNVLIQLAESDKHFAESEWNVISHIAAINNIEIEEVYDIMRAPEPIDSLEKLDDETKFEYLYNCIELIMADNKLLECEINFCRNVAEKLRIKHEAVDFLINHIGKTSFNQLQSNIISSYK